MGRREDNKRRKREALLEHGLAAFLGEGYDRASIERIAEAAGVARGTFYLYFADKLALFDAVMDEWFVPILGVLDDTGEALLAAEGPAGALEVYRGMATGLAIVGLAHRDAVEVALRESRRSGEAGASLRQREQAMLERVTRFTDLALDRGLIHTTAPRLVGLVVFGAVERLFYEVICGTDLGDPTAAAQEVLRLFAAALGMDDAQSASSAPAASTRTASRSSSSS
ncbi:MAG: TetR/AcrR family transcriptional regulator [Alphaproteobacteria bacterium]|nr:TetR/AcrR family transcriptional regulator [Alphaproteobacteria bacterium]MCB9695281.1 TetR/AcrR family transcriptional regulator [Alphaproteobacteria bacterium]